MKRLGHLAGILYFHGRFRVSLLFRGQFFLCRLLIGLGLFRRGLCCQKMPAGIYRVLGLT